MSEKSVFARIAEYLRSSDADEAPSKASIVKSDGYVRGSSGMGTGMADSTVHAIQSRK